MVTLVPDHQMSELWNMLCREWHGSWGDEVKETERDGKVLLAIVPYHAETSEEKGTLRGWSEKRLKGIEQMDSVPTGPLRFASPPGSSGMLLAAD